MNKAFKLGITCEGQLKRMVGLCAPTTHPLGNRRYDEYIFLINKDKVEDINLDKIPKDEVCPDCNDDGDFCLTCGAG